MLSQKKSSTPSVKITRGTVMPYTSENSQKTMSKRTLREQNPCPKCGREAEWLEEHPHEIEFGCENNHRWFVEK